MALKLEGLRGQRSSRAVFVSTRRLYLNADDEVIEAGEPGAIALLVAAGGGLPMATAESYGLVQVAPAQVVAADATAHVTTFDAETDALRDGPSEAVEGALVADQKGNTVKQGEGFEDKQLGPAEDKTADPTPASADASSTPKSDADEAELALRAADADFLAGNVGALRERLGDEDDVERLERLLALETRTTAVAAIEKRIADLSAE